MKFETYAKAVELNERMSYLIEIQGLLENACNSKLLATISDCEYEDARKIVITKCKVQQHARLDSDIREKLLQIIRDEYNKTYEEFIAL